MGGGIITSNKILYYISGFGFGHLTRSAAIIEALLSCREDIFITIKCSAGQSWFIRNYLPAYEARIAILPFESNFRIVFDEKIMGVDVRATVQEIEKWLGGLRGIIDDEIRQVRTEYALVVSDIAPEAFAVAEHLKVPGIAIANFTWYEIIRGFASEASMLYLKELYEKATVLLEYSLSTGEELPIKQRVPAGLVARPIDADKVRMIRAQYKRPGRLLLFLSIGGALHISNFPLCPSVDFLYTQGVSLPASANAHAIGADVPDTQNYLAACDGVITKCGWSTVAEALIAQKPLYLLTSSNGWVEERHMLRGLKELGAGKIIRREDLINLPSGVFAEAVNIGNPAGRLFRNNVAAVARKLLEYAAADG